MTNYQLFFLPVKSFNLWQVELLLSLKLFFTILTKGFHFVGNFTIYDVDDDNDVEDDVGVGDDVGDNVEDGDGDVGDDVEDGDDDALKASMMKWQRLKLRGRHYGNASPGELERCNTDVDFNHQYTVIIMNILMSMVTIQKQNWEKV